MIKKTFLFTLLLLISTKLDVYSHPWGGLVIDSTGNIYFSFICPIVDDDHYACVWRINTNNEISEVLKSGHSPSDIVLSRAPNRSIFAAVRTGQHPNYLNQLWKITGRESEQILESQNNDETFKINVYAALNDSTVVYSRDHRIFESSTNSQFANGIEFDNIQLLLAGPNGSLYIVADDNLFNLKDSNLKMIASGLREDSPSNIPFRGANILFDMTIDQDGNAYLAYYGDRKVLKVSNKGVISTIYESEAPFSPHGVDIYNGEIYVLESTIGDGRWWKFWNQEDDEIVPRINRIDIDGTVSNVFTYKANRN